MAEQGTPQRFMCPLTTCRKTYATTSKFKPHILTHVSKGELPEPPLNNRGELLYATYRYTAAEDAGYETLQGCAQEADTARLTVPDQDLRNWINTGFKVAAGQFAARVRPDAAAAHDKFDPAAAAESLLAFHIHHLPQDAAMQQRVLRVYHEMFDFAQPAEVTTFHVLEHPSSTVADAMQAVRQAGDKFSRDGVILVKAGSSSFSRQRKLGRFVQHGGQIRAWPGEEELGEGSCWSSQDPKLASASVHEMATWGTAAEDAVCKLATCWGLADIVDQPLQRFCFTSALLRCLPSDLHTLYEPELDIMTNDKHSMLLRGREGTLLDTESARLPAVGFSDKKELDLTVDIGGPNTASRSNSQAASAWSLSDDATGPLIRKMFDHERSTSHPVRLALGVQIAGIIISLPYTYTSAHIEDLLLGAVNMLVDGAWKVWYIVPPACADKFKAVMLRKHGPGALARILAKKLRPDLTAAEMAEVGIRLLFQPPGFMVVSCPGEVYHWTVSLGYSVAEAANCFIQLPGAPSLAETVQHWEQHVKEAAADWQLWKAAKPKAATTIKKAWDARLAVSKKVQTYLRV